MRVSVILIILYMHLTIYYYFSLVLHLPVCLSVCLFVCLFVYLFVFFCSDDDIDGTWEIEKAFDDLDEVLDMSVEEKDFIKLWNRFAASRGGIYSRSEAPQICLEFVQSAIDHFVRAPWLRYQFMLHLVTLYRFSLISGDEAVHLLVDVLDRAVYERTTTMVSTADKTRRSRGKGK